ncbi:MAG: AAA family ATPase, partial [Proteobacteria bacterium]|nr:AAA family ATPase [Pseudomonadota bacterium]
RDPRDYTPKHLVGKILQSRSALEGERKQVTILFADVKGSMELAEGLDPEEWHGILDRFFSILADGVHRFEGTVNQYTGDGIMALFGAPIAHEDHAQRACYAALQLRDELGAHAREVKREHGLAFSVRMGLHSGEVVVGKIGDDLRMDYTAQGHCVGLASRMQDLASPDTCYLTGDTAALVRGYFELEDLGGFNVKGVSEPVPVFELKGASGLRTRFDISRARGLSRFVGRGDDMRTLETALAQAEGADGQVVGIVGEPGVGKSRLCFEFLEACRARGLRVLVGRAVAHGKNIPLLPILQAFREYFDIEDGDPDQRVREKIAGRMLLFDEEYRDALPILFDFFGVPDPERPTPRMDPEARQRRLFGVLRRSVQRDNSEGTVVTLIEDLHWLDGASEAWLEQWVNAHAGSQNLLVVNFRPEYRADWMQQPWYRQLPLRSLGPDAIRELLDDLLGDEASVDALARSIHERTAGNPFFTEEVVHTLVESGHLEGERGSYRLVTPVDRLEVPTSVQSLLASRIDRLPEREKQVLQTAAVLGKDFPESILAEVVDVPAAELPDALQRLKAGDFLYEESLYPVVEYAFKHPLTQEVALHSQLRERRRKTHERAARAIEAARADRLDEAAALLAHHWGEAGFALEAARWHERAGAFIGTSDYAEALRHAQRVRELLAQVPDEAEAPGLGARACREVLANAVRMGMSEAERDEVFQEGLRWAEATGDPFFVGRLHQAYSVTLSLTVFRFEKSIEHAREWERVAGSLPDEARRATKLWPSIEPRLYHGDLLEVRESCEWQLEATRGHPEWGLADWGVSAHAYVLYLLGASRSYDSPLAHAIEALEEALALARRLNDPEDEAWASAALAETSYFAGDPEIGRAAARRAVEIAENIGTPFLRASTHQRLGLVLLLDGEAKQAVESA